MNKQLLKYSLDSVNCKLIDSITNEDLISKNSRIKVIIKDSNVYLTVYNPDTTSLFIKIY